MNASRSSRRAAARSGGARSMPAPYSEQAAGHRDRAADRAPTSAASAGLALEGLGPLGDRLRLGDAGRPDRRALRLALGRRRRAGRPPADMDRKVVLTRNSVPRTI